jgi:transposase
MVAFENVSTDDLRQVLAEVEGKKPTQRLMAAINYLEDDDLTQKEAAERYGYTGGWLSRWLDLLERLADEPFEQVVYDEPRSGRPSELSDQKHGRFVDALHESLEGVGIDAPAWSVPLASKYLSEEFDVDHCDRHVRRLMTEAGLSWKTAQPEYYKSDERAQDAFQDGFKKRRTIWTTSTRSSP